MPRSRIQFQIVTNWQDEDLWDDPSNSSRNRPRGLICVDEENRREVPCKILFEFARFENWLPVEIGKFYDNSSRLYPMKEVVIICCYKMEVVNRIVCRTSALYGRLLANYSRLW
jgi:hypothetical protein